GSNFFIADDIALEVPKGVRIWAQSHYINSSDRKRLVQDVINLTLVPVDEVREIASTFAQLDLTFALPPQQATTRTVECSPHQEMYVPCRAGMRYRFRLLYRHDDALHIPGI
ncbi:MAG: hypothetical protein ABFS02_14085, partial [Pseudomonadota bacterium]